MITAKALRRIDTKVFIEIVEVSEANYKSFVCTSELPVLQPLSATIDLMKFCFQNSPEILWDEYEFVTLSISEI